jgi:hypothetical protein
MSTPKPGQIRCPTCHSSTPPAAYCTACGAPIPASARMRPRGMDRSELEERLRARRPNEGPFRRGGVQGDEGAWARPFEPEPEDALARREEPGDLPARHVDNLPADYEAPAYEEPAYEEPAYQPPPPAPARPEPTRAEPQWRRGDPLPPEPEPEPARPVEPALQVRRGAPPAPVAYAVPEEPEEPYLDEDDEYLDEYDYPYGDATQEVPRRSGGGPLMIVGLAALGLAALLAGVLLSGLFAPGPGVALESPTPTERPAASAAATPSDAASAEASGSPVPSDGPPQTFDDGFTADTQPCAAEPESPTGCDSSGTQIAAGDPLWVWIGFKRGTNDDVIGITVVDTASGSSVADASYELARLGAQSDRFNGWLKFPFSGIGAGDYQIRISRNGVPAAEASFSVGG